MIRTCYVCDGCGHDLTLSSTFAVRETGKGWRVLAESEGMRHIIVAGGDAHACSRECARRVSLREHDALMADPVIDGQAAQ